MRAVMTMVCALILAACSSDNSTSPPATGAPAGGSEVPLAAAGKSYVDAVTARDLESLVGAFTEDAVIVDVGRRIEGQDHIRRWADNEVIGGAIEVLGVEPMTGGQDLLVRFDPSGGDGGFEAHYRFTYRDGKIAQADLTYA